MVVLSRCGFDSNSFLLDVFMTLPHPSKHLTHSLKPRDVCFSSEVFRPQSWDSSYTAKTQTESTDPSSCVFL